MPTTTCWRCSKPLKQPGAAFCALCGAAQKPDDPAAAREWQVRLTESDPPPSPPLSFLWLLVWGAAPLVFPVLLAKASNRLKRHVKARLDASAFASGRFTGSTEGKAVARLLATSVGSLKSSGVAAAFLCYALMAWLLGMIFLIPSTAPARISYESALNALLEVRPAHGWIYINGPRQYDDAWNTLYPQWYRNVTVNGSSVHGQELTEGPKNARTWEEGDVDTPYQHRSYYYLATGDRWTNQPQLRKVSSIQVSWNGSVTAGVFVYIGFGLLHVLFVVFGLVFWVRFMRHREAEALAAAYAKGDTAYHDRLIAEVRGRNQRLGVLVVPLTILGLHVFVFPILWAFVFAGHLEAERKAGIATALGFDRGPSVPA